MALLVAAAAVLVAAAAPQRAGSTLTTRLTWRTGKYHAYRVLLPSTWRYRDASYPSDHGTFLYYDPSNPLLRMYVIVSGCVGCVETDFDPHRPNPKAEAPDYATGFYWISPWKLAFSGYSTDDPYPANGLVIVLSQNGSVAGSEIVELWLPQRQHQLATTILNSFHAYP